MKLKLTDDQRAAKHHFYSLGTDQEGREILLGLTHEESGWYLEYLDRKRDPESRKFVSAEEQQRWRELAERHEIARLEMVGSVHLAKQDPVRH